MRNLLIVLLGLFPSLLHAEPVRTPHVTADLVAEQGSVKPGSSLWVGLRLEMEPHWHTYWRFPGDSGLATKVKWELPPGWEISEAHWPIPERILLPPLVNFGYNGAALIAFELKVPAGTAAGAQNLAAKASWLVCKEECIPGKAELKLAVNVADAPAKALPLASAFAQVRREQPQPLVQGAFSSLKIEGKRIGLQFENEGGWLKEKTDFFPLAPLLVTGFAPPKQERKQDLVTLWLDKSTPFANDAAALPGMLVVGTGKDRIAYEFSAPLKAEGALAAAGITSASLVPPADTSLPLAMLLAFLGGLLLNLMPCVFPVLGIKVMALVSQGAGNRWHSRAHAKVYALGVLVSFWVLTAVLLTLRMAGESVGWGFQLQQPGFVIAMIFLFSFLTASLAGFFEFGGRFMGIGAGLAAKEGMAGSFFTGILAVVVATPCTAPFMGTAIGVVLAKPAWAAFVVFTFLGLGLATPFVILSYQPQWLRVLPRPGAWMERLKEFFAFPLAATVLWLFWVLGLQIGLNGLVLVALGLLLLFAAIWAAHRFSGIAGQALSWILFASAVLVAAYSLRVQPNITLAAQGEWQNYSAAKVDEALQAKKAVFVDFTAAWCLTCQVNKTLVLDRAAMQDFLRSKNVVLFRGDWTNSDPEITKALEKEGRIGVPLYLAYPAGSSQAQALPQILTDEIIRSAFP